MKKTCIQKEGTKTKPNIKFTTSNKEQDLDDTVIQEEEESPKLEPGEVAV